MGKPVNQVFAQDVRYMPSGTDKYVKGRIILLTNV